MNVPDSNPMTAVHIQTRDGVLFCGFVNPNPRKYGLIHGGINAATCKACAAGFVASGEAPALCSICGCRHEHGPLGILCRILSETGLKAIA